MSIFNFLYKDRLRRLDEFGIFTLRVSIDKPLNIDKTSHFIISYIIRINLISENCCKYWKMSCCAFVGTSIKH